MSHSTSSSPPPAAPKLCPVTKKTGNVGAGPLLPEEGKTLMRRLLSLGHASCRSDAAEEVRGSLRQASVWRTRVAMSRLRRARTVLVGLTALLAFTVLSSAAAWAGLTHNFVSSFGSFSSVEGVAVDQASGDIYVYDAGAGDLYKFDASGNPSGFAGIAGEPNVIEGVGNAGEGEGELAIDNSAGPAKGDIYLANGSVVKVFAGDGSLLGSLDGGSGGGKACGVAVDPPGNVYVSLLGLSSSRVARYAPSANPVSSSDYSSTLWGLDHVCDIAVDSAGSVYADTLSDGPVNKYEALQFSSVEMQAYGTQISENARAVAVDPANEELYAARYNEVLQYESSGTQASHFSGQGPGYFGNLHGIAVKGSSGRIYLANNEPPEISVYGPAVVMPDVTTGAATAITKTSALLQGTVNPNGLETTCRFEYNGQTVPCASNPGSGTEPVQVSVTLSGLGENKTYSYRLIVTNENGTSYGQERSFTTLSVPLIGEQYVTSVTTSNVTIKTRIDPAGSPTTYRVEYGTDSNYGMSAPVPDGNAGSINEYIDFSQVLKSLQAGTTYHYRVVASNANGTAIGSDLTFTTWPVSGPPEADHCPNAALREGTYSTVLPDCRAYEMVSPVDKNGGGVFAYQGGHAPDSAQFVSSVSGNAVQYGVRTAFGNIPGTGFGGYTQYIARRAQNGWSSNGITPTPSAEQSALFGGTLVEAFSEELDKAVVSGLGLPGATGGIPKNMNYYMEDPFTARVTETISPMENPQEAETNPVTFYINFYAYNCGLRGVSADLGVVTFQSPTNYTTQTTGNLAKLYAFEHGALRLAGILPDGEVPAGGSESPEQCYTATGEEDTVSRDGSRIVFQSPVDGSAPAQLYMRKNATSTVWISEPETSPGNSEPPQKVSFNRASPDDKHVLFTSADRLTANDPGAAVAPMGLYEYSDGSEPDKESNLTFIARIDPEYSEYQVTAVSDDGSRVYFYSKVPNVTLPGAGFLLWDSGHIRALALPTAQPGEVARASADGTIYAYFGSVFARLTNSVYHPLYVYDERNNSVKCVSCPQTGALAVSDVTIYPISSGGAAPLLNLIYQPRFVTNNGRYVFFNTADALVPQDTNGVYDGYEYNTETGKLSLLAPGSTEYGVSFAAANDEGTNVFLTTQDKLSRSDVDNAVDIYDARIDGGLPEPPPPPASCAGDECQGLPSPAPAFNTASSFNGLGNVVFASPGKAKSRSSAHHKHATKRLRGCHKRDGRRRLRCQANTRRRHHGHMRRIVRASARAGN